MSMWICFGILGMLTVCLTVNQIVITTKARTRMDSFHDRLDTLRNLQRNDFNIVLDRINRLERCVKELEKDEEDDQLSDAVDYLWDMIDELQDEMDENEHVDNAYGEALKSFSAKIDEIQEKLDAIIKDISALK